MCDEIFLNTVLTVGTADTTLLHTCMEALYGLEVLTVDVGLAELEFTAGLRGDVQVLGEDGRSESVLTVVGPLDGLIDGVELYQGDDGAEGLLMDDVHLLRTVVEYGSCIEVALVANALTTTEQFRTLLDGTRCRPCRDRPP